MQAPAPAHPTSDTLKAYSRGTLDDTQVEAVESHLGSCSDCQKQVEGASAGDFSKRLGEARVHNATVALPGRSPSDSEMANQLTASFPAVSTRVPDLPPELASHPHYEVIRKLGAGGMGVVYLARHRLSGREEVLKVMNQALLSHPEKRERFLREIRSVAVLDHPNVVKMHTALEVGEFIVLVMEYGGAENLAELAKNRRSPMPILNACYYIKQAALGLQHAFEKNVVHRDIKPGNLIVSRQGKKHVVKLLDFGLAKVRAESNPSLHLTATGQIVGTPAYMAPEQARDSSAADIRADIYSLGCSLYYLISGSLPFSAKTEVEMLFAHRSIEPIPLNEVRGDVPRELAAIVSKKMAKDPANRFQTPVEVAQALASFIKAEQTSSKGDTKEGSAAGS